MKTLVESLEDEKNVEPIDNNTNLFLKIIEPKKEESEFDIRQINSSTRRPNISQFIQRRHIENIEEIVKPVDGEIIESKKEEPESESEIKQNTNFTRRFNRSQFIQRGHIGNTE